MQEKDRNATILREHRPFHPITPSNCALIYLIHTLLSYPSLPLRPRSQHHHRQSS